MTEPWWITFLLGFIPFGGWIVMMDNLMGIEHEEWVDGFRTACILLMAILWAITAVLLIVAP
jgi:hypothetical protein